MSVRIRLARTGKKHQPSFRIVVANSRSKRNGKIIENLGFYNPLTEPATIQVNRERFDYWLSVGAQPSDVVRELVLGQKRIRKKAKKPVTTEAQKEKETQKKEEAAKEES